MRNYQKVALAVMAVTLLAYPFLKAIAYAERGYWAVGGEELVIVFGIFAALWMLQYGAEREREAAAAEEYFARRREMLAARNAEGAGKARVVPTACEVYSRLELLKPGGDGNRAGGNGNSGGAVCSRQYIK